MDYIKTMYCLHPEWFIWGFVGCCIIGIFSLFCVLAIEPKKESK